MITPDNLCRGCYFNSANDFFDPGFDQDNKPVEVCYWDRQPYPHARMCDKYEPAHKVDGD